MSEKVKGKPCFACHQSKINEIVKVICKMVKIGKQILQLKIVFFILLFKVIHQNIINIKSNNLPYLRGL
jgi:hypothetical protein